MNNLTDSLPLDVLKALAKRFQKLKKSEGNSDLSLMSVQEDLARAAGHRDMHAAQAYWEHKLAPAHADGPVSATAEITVHTLVKEAADRLARAHGWFSIDQLIQTHFNFSKEELDDDPDIAEKQATIQVREALKDVTHFHFDPDGDKLTTKAWIRECLHTLPKLSVRKDNAAKIKFVLNPYLEALDTAHKNAGIGACNAAMVVALEASPGAGSSLVAKGIADSYGKAGWKVIATSSSWNAGKILGNILGLANDHIDSADVLIDRVARGGTPFTKPTLVMVGDGQSIPVMVMAELARVALDADHPVKLVVMGDINNAIPFNGFSAIARNCDVHRLTDTMPHVDAGLENKQATARMSDEEKFARGVDPAILGRAFIQVLNEPSISWRHRPFHEFSDAMAARAAEMNDASNSARAPGRKPGSRR